MQLRTFMPVILVAAVLGSLGCSRTVVVKNRPAMAAKRGPSPAATLGIPPGHLPPPGQCRVWIPGRAPGHQAKARSCRRIEHAAPTGAWILYRPDRDRKVVHVRHVHAKRAGIIVRVGIYEANSGKFLREENP